MIALPGLCLTTQRPDVAREILLSFADYVNGGMLPNRFPDAGQAPEYNTVDATLWYFVAIWRYVAATGDLDLLRTRLWPVLEEIVARHRQGTRYNIHVDGADHLLYAGQSGVQLTWMDAKVGDWVVTPRIGKPVEVNALWCNALRTMADFAQRLGHVEEAQTYSADAQQTAGSFVARFVRPDGHGLYDVLDMPEGGQPDAAIRPNQVFALSLPFAPVAPAAPVAQAILSTVREELLTPCGLRTLSPNDPGYRARYEGGPTARDGAYHQGTVWPWLLGPYAEAYHKVTGDRDGALALLRPLQDQLSVYGIGTLAEVYDGSAPQRPNGCIAQAWSVAETLRVWTLISTL
jgi:predicted glycogen debranching enzyme